MSVLIKGMEMPTSCDSCRIMEFEDTNCVEEFYCGCPIVFKAHPQGVDHRPDYCPLIEVPEPHGRLIDADAIPYKKIMYDDDDFYYGVTKPYIDRIPTVIPASEEVST